MRVVLDTNVVASALLWGGTPERLIEAAGEGALELFTSEPLLAELAGILGRAKFAARLKQKNVSAAEIVARYREIAETIEAEPIEVAQLRDPDDSAVLACALAARAEALISGDDDTRARHLSEHSRPHSSRMPEKNRRVGVQRVLASRYCKTGVTPLIGRTPKSTTGV